MHLYSTIKNFLLDFDYYIDIYEDKIHIFNFTDILKLNDKEINLQVKDFKLEIKGRNFSVKKLDTREILIEGNIEGLNIIK
jgi:sporulation protein YqfC